jgi:hypothetical protein
LFDGVSDLDLELAETTGSRLVTHLTYRIARAAEVPPGASAAANVG